MDPKLQAVLRSARSLCKTADYLGTNIKGSVTDLKSAIADFDREVNRLRFRRRGEEQRHLDEVFSGFPDADKMTQEEEDDYLNDLEQWHDEDRARRGM